jgi:formylglycine-generating enzyme required for sulfatase activity
MVLVPAGGFWMGCNGVRDSSCFDDEEPQHAVCLDAFEIDETEVTVAQYAACVDDGGCMNAGDTSEFCNSGESGRSDHPINCVDWDQAKAYCEWAGKRLPTEAEWEKAARGGCELYGDDCKTAMPIYPWGDEEPKCDRATSSGCGDGTRPVWSTPHGASPYLAQDMAGNVWEWVADWNGSYDHGLAMNPSGPSSGAFRVVRGGSFAYGAPYLRASVRYDFSPGYSYGYLGFRCARSVP